MREILFCGQREDNGEWITGYYFQKPNVYTEDGQPIEHFITDLPPFCAKVIPETVGQYTGLTDKNGRKIFEGDIVLKSDINPLGWCRERKCKVSFANTGYWTLITEYGDLYWIGEYEMEQIEVIGNIYDNPELVEVGE